MLRIIKNRIKFIAFKLVRKYWILKFSPYKRIVVTGCQRSGTTAVSQMIASDFGFRNIDEYEFGTDDYDNFRELLNLEEIVIQCPAITQHLHLIDTKDTLIIWLIRPYSEIRKSMERINWDVEHEQGEKNNYSKLPGFNQHDPIEITKTEYWHNYQKKAIKCQFIDFNYHSLYVKLHPLFISKKYRSNLKSKQTKL